MKRSVKPRTYKSELRAEAAERTRHAILEAAWRVLTERGYAAMTMQAVADEAHVALDTVYASVGRKPVLVSLLIESAVSMSANALPAEQREYVQRVHAAKSAREKLAIYADAVARIQVRLAPVVTAIQGAEPDVMKHWKAVEARRARNMRILAEELVATGELRAELDVDHIRDVLWTMNSPEFFMLLVRERGWSPEIFGQWLADAWARLFLQ
jgi:AcrR family transcriptional regulator